MKRSLLAVTALATLALSACATQSGGTGSGNVRGTRKPGEGRCQLSETRTEINAEFPRQS